MSRQKHNNNNNFTFKFKPNLCEPWYRTRIRKTSRHVRISPDVLVQDETRKKMKCETKKWKPEKIPTSTKQIRNKKKSVYLTADDCKRIGQSATMNSCLCGDRRAYCVIVVTTTTRLSFAYCSTAIRWRCDHSTTYAVMLWRCRNFIIILADDVVTAARILWSPCHDVFVCVCGCVGVYVLY